MPEVSIIVPVYNVAPYLGECIASIVSQTFTDWELILVDDGSTDNSADIAKEWRDKDRRIKLYSKPNGGVSSARNFGLDHATSKYIMFVDSDDICHPKILEILYYFTGTGVELTMCDCIRFQTTPVVSTLEEYSPEILINLDETYRCMALKHILHSPYAKLYQREIIERNGIRFPLGVQLGEDVLFNLNFLKHISSSVHINLPLYYYRDTPSSLSKKIQKDYAEIQLRILSEKLNFISTHDINFDYTPYAPGIVRDIALTTIRSDMSNTEKIDCLNNLRNHRIMGYCKTTGRFSDVALAKVIKILPSKILLSLLK